MPSSALVILVLVVVIGWFAWRLLRRRPSAPPPSMPEIVSGGLVEAASSTVRPVIAQNVETALARLASRARPRGIGDLTTVVQARIADQGPADWHFNFTDGSCVLVRGPADRASLTISADSQVWHDLAAKRIGFMGANMKGSLRSEGDLGILMKLDDALAGPADESLLVGADQTPVTPDEESQNPTSKPAVAGVSGPVVLDRGSLIDAIRAVRENPNLSAAERQAAMVEAIRHNLGPGAVTAINRGDGATGNSFTSVTISSDSRVAGPDFRGAVQEALRDLPPDATREQKMAAIKAALGKMPDAAPFAAMLEAHASETSRGVGGKVAELMIEGLLEGLLGGN